MDGAYYLTCIEGKTTISATGTSSSLIISCIISIRSTISNATHPRTIIARITNVFIIHMILCWRYKYYFLDCLNIILSRLPIKLIFCGLTSGCCISTSTAFSASRFRWSYVIFPHTFVSKMTHFHLCLTCHIWEQQILFLSDTEISAKTV